MISIDNGGVVKDLLEEARKFVQTVQTDKMRLVEITQNRIQRIVPPNTNMDELLWFSISYRIEVPFSFFRSTQTLRSSCLVTFLETLPSKTIIGRAFWYSLSILYKSSFSTFPLLKFCSSLRKLKKSCSHTTVTIPKPTFLNCDSNQGRNETYLACIQFKCGYQLKCS